MTSFYHFTHRLVRRFSYCCTILLQGPAGWQELHPSWGVPEEYNKLRAKMLRASYPIDFAPTSARATKEGVEFHGFARHGLSQKEVPVHVYIR
jgi:hypothetical protein